MRGAGRLRRLTRLARAAVMDHGTQAELQALGPEFHDWLGDVNVLALVAQKVALRRRGEAP